MNGLKDTREYDENDDDDGKKHTADAISIFLFPSRT